MAVGRLDQHERYRIRSLHEANYSLREIAISLDRSPSTLSRELTRNAVGGRYEPCRAQRLSEHRRSQASRRPWIAPETIERIEAHLREDWSPEQIAGTTGLQSWRRARVWATGRSTRCTPHVARRWW